MMPKKPNRVWLILFIGVAFLTIASIARINSGKDLVPWRDDLSAAAKESALTHKPVFLDFTASWCGPCQSMKTSTWADAKVAKSLSDYVPVSVDLDAHPDLAKKYDIQAIPAFIVLDPDGKPIKNSVGYLDAEEFLSWLKS